MQYLLETSKVIVEYFLNAYREPIHIMQHLIKVLALVRSLDFLLRK